MLSFYTTILTLLVLISISIIRIYETIIIMMNGKMWIIVNIITIPIMISFLLFPVNFVITNISLLLLNSKYLLTNSKYYSYTNRYKEKEINNPDITINIPIYDEDFRKVIRPTLRSCIKAREMYKRKGGKCNIVVMME